MDNKGYIVKSSEESLCGKNIVINSLIPKFNKYEEKKVREDIGNKLFYIFKKYV